MGKAAPGRASRVPIEQVVERGHERARFLRAFGVAGAMTALFAAWLGWGLGGETSVRYVDDLATVLAAFAAAALCVRAAIRYEGAAAPGRVAAGRGVWRLDARRAALGPVRPGPARGGAGALVGGRGVPRGHPAGRGGAPLAPGDARQRNREDPLRARRLRDRHSPAVSQLDARA